VSAEGLALTLPVETERLVLRAHRADDLDDLLRFHSDPEVVRWTPWPVRDRAATEETLASKIGMTELREPGQWLVLAIEERATGTVIGEALLEWASERQGELGFALGRDHHGRGYAAEAATAMMRLGFDELGFHRITAVCIDENVASAGLLRKLGFRQEARLVDNVLFKGAWATQLVFAMLEDEWRARRTDPTHRDRVRPRGGLLQREPIGPYDGQAGTVRR
jgi:RimJ/RimL family protein N-acetyltransferase